MTGFTKVILASFTVPRRQMAGAHELSAALRQDSNIAIQYVHAITDMAQYCSYMQQTIG